MSAGGITPPVCISAAVATGGITPPAPAGEASVAARDGAAVGVKDVAAVKDNPRSRGRRLWRCRAPRTPRNGGRCLGASLDPALDSSHSPRADFQHWVPMRIERLVQRHCLDCGPEDMQGKKVRSLDRTAILIGRHAVLGDFVGVVRASVEDELVETPIVEQRCPRTVVGCLEGRVVASVVGSLAFESPPCIAR